MICFLDKGCMVQRRSLFFQELFLVLLVFFFVIGLNRVCITLHFFSKFSASIIERKNFAN